MRQKLLLLIVGLLVMSTSVFAQTITGKVTTGPNGEPLPGVSVVVKGTTLGTTTSSTGQYSDSATSKSVLVFSFIGYKTQEVAVGNRKAVDVVLSEDEAQLGEVVVTALGIQREQRKLE